jgi:hypothetical protein
VASRSLQERNHFAYLNSPSSILSTSAQIMNRVHSSSDADDGHSNGSSAESITRPRASPSRSASIPHISADEQPSFLTRRNLSQTNNNDTDTTPSILLGYASSEREGNVSPRLRDGLATLQTLSSSEELTDTQNPWRARGYIYEGLSNNNSNDSFPSLQTISDSSDEDLAMAEEQNINPWDDDDGRLAEQIDAESDSERDVDDLQEQFPEIYSNPILHNTFMEFAEALSLGIGQNSVPADGPIPGISNQSAALLNRISRHVRMMFNVPPEDEIQDDPRRAAIILKALEHIPSSLVIRYEQLRKGADGEDGDGCAICRDTLVTDQDSPKLPLSETEDFFAVLPFCLPRLHSDRVLAFPCQGMHLFHAGCLAPWLARKTTCPTCRFDIDPDSMTLRNQRDPLTGQSLAKLWSPAGGRRFTQWLMEEENRLSEECPTTREYCGVNVCKVSY